MIKEEKYHHALYALHQIYVRIRFMAATKEPLSDIVRLSDYAEIMPEYIASEIDQTERFVSCLKGITESFPHFRYILDTFNSDANPYGWLNQKKMNERYSRQILFREIGKAGQEKLLNSRVLLIGCGALGASHAEILARAGVGFLRIVDRDFVEFTNLQRQTLFSENDAKERLPKAIAAKNRLAEINSEIEVEAVVADVNNSNIESFIKDIDLVLDGTDNFQIRYLINDACVKHKKPWIYGAAVSSYGTTMTIFPRETPCLRCVFEEMPSAGSAPTCDTAGVIQPIISSISAIQTTEALKILTGNRAQLHKALIQIDVWNNDWRKIKLGVPVEDCETCAGGNFEFLDLETGEFSAVLCGREAVQIAPPKPTKIDLPQLAERLKILGEVKQNEYLVRFTSGENELTVFADARAIIRGTDDVSVARSLYAKFVGV